MVSKPFILKFLFLIHFFKYFFVKFFPGSLLPRTRVHYRVTHGVLPPSTDGRVQAPCSISLQYKSWSWCSNYVKCDPIVAWRLQLLLGSSNCYSTSSIVSQRGSIISRRRDIFFQVEQFYYPMGNFGVPIFYPLFRYFFATLACNLQQITIFFRADPPNNSFSLQF